MNRLIVAHLKALYLISKTKKGVRNFDFKYLTIFDKVRSLLSVKNFRIMYNGQSANMVEITNNVRGVIMPLRD